MSELTEGLASWRSVMRRRTTLSDEELEELEGHLVDDVERLVASGCPPVAAIGRASDRLGLAENIDRAFRAQRIPQTARQRLVWMLTGYVVLVGIQVLARLVATFVTRTGLPQWLGTPSLVLLSVYAALVAGMVVFGARTVVACSWPRGWPGATIPRFADSIGRGGWWSHALLAPGLVVGLVAATLAIDSWQWWGAFRHIQSARALGWTNHWIDLFESALGPALAFAAILALRFGRGAGRSVRDAASGPGSMPGTKAVR